MIKMIKLGHIEKCAANKLSLSLSKLAKSFRDMKEDDLADTTLLAIAAISGVENPNSDITFSYIMRTINKNNPEKAIKFFKQFKESADEAFIQGIDPEQIEAVALMEALQKLEISPEEINDTKNV
jgi:hypothetical protein